MLSIPIGASLGPGRGRWVVLSYEQSFASRPVRPHLRWVRRDRPPIDAVLPAATLGHASWLGIVPEDLVEAELRFGLEDPGLVRVLAPDFPPPWQLWRQLLRTNPLGALLDLLPPAFHARRVRTNIMRAGVRQEPLDRFADFAAAHARPLEPEGFDRPVPAGSAPGIRLVLRLGPDSIPGLAVTLDALRAQVDPAWSLVILAEGDAARAAAETRLADPRIGIGGGSASAPHPDPGARGWIGWIEPGDRLAPFAVLAARAEIRERPGLALLYTDSVAIDPDGVVRTPDFHPGWSPTYLRAVDYIGGLCLVSPTFAQAALADRDPAHPDARMTVLRHAADTLGRAEVSHLPRFALLREATAAVRREQRRQDDPPRPPRLVPAAAKPPGSDLVSIVIPTRDRIDLLLPAVETLLARTDPAGFELIVADNGSRDEAALAFLREIDGRGRTRVLRVEGPFNFSRIVNVGVAASRGEVVVLLNNDVEITRPDWLSELLACMTEPDVGAVGAQLLYPDGTVQHMGTVVGLWGYAGHFGRLRPPDAPGHLGRLPVPYEVSAVTAACLAVRRSHFDLVGGLDEAYAVTFNDVDFCLRLGERGLRNLINPRAVMTHRETASRGKDQGARRARFREERRMFGERWRGVMQDDPYFHLGLALYTSTDRLE